MIDAKKLQNTINELENHTATLARVAGLYNKLEVCKSELDELQKSMATTDDKFRISASALNDGINKLKFFLDKILLEISRGNDEARQALINGLAVLKIDQIKVIETGVNDIQSLLVKHKSDVEVSVRNEGTQIQRGLENVVKEKHLLMQTILNNSLADMSEKLSNQRKYVFIGLALNAVNLIILLSACVWLLIK